MIHFCSSYKICSDIHITHTKFFRQLFGVHKRSIAPRHSIFIGLRWSRIGTRTGIACLQVAIIVIKCPRVAIYIRSKLFCFLHCFTHILAAKKSTCCMSILDTIIHPINKFISRLCSRVGFIRHRIKYCWQTNRSLTSTSLIIITPLKIPILPFSLIMLPIFLNCRIDFFHLCVISRHINAFFIFINKLIKHARISHTKPRFRIKKCRQLIAKLII